VNIRSTTIANGDGFRSCSVSLLRRGKRDKFGVGEKITGRTAPDKHDFMRGISGVVQQF